MCAVQLRLRRSGTEVNRFFKFRLLSPYCYSCNWFTIHGTIMAIFATLRNDWRQMTSESIRSDLLCNIWGYVTFILCSFCATTHSMCETCGLRKWDPSKDNQTYLVILFWQILFIWQNLVLFSCYALIRLGYCNFAISNQQTWGILHCLSQFKVSKCLYVVSNVTNLLFLSIPILIISGKTHLVKRAKSFLH